MQQQQLLIQTLKAECAKRGATGQPGLLREQYGIKYSTVTVDFWRELLNTLVAEHDAELTEFQVYNADWYTRVKVVN